jgi:hypothetical protein
MIRANPDIFPNFYSIQTLYVDRLYFKKIKEFAMGLKKWFNWLPIVLLQDNGDMLRIFDIWETWRGVHIDSPEEDGIKIPYYSHIQFAEDFLRFVENYYIKEIAKFKAAISAIVSIEHLHIESRKTSHSIEKDSLVFQMISIPMISKNLQVMELDLDYKELLERIKNRRSLEQIPAKKTKIALLRKVNNEQMETTILILSALSEKLLDLCDGNRSVNDIIEIFSMHTADFDGISAKKVCFFGLSYLFEKEFIRISN